MHGEQIDHGQPTIARVLLDSNLPQLDHLYDYRIPENLRGELRLGHRVKVPFRSRQRDTLGYVIELVTQSEFAGELAEVSSLVSPVPLIAPGIWQLARAVADRAGGSAADILRLAIPPRQVRVEQAFLRTREALAEASPEADTASSAGTSAGTRGSLSQTDGGSKPVELVEPANTLLDSVKSESAITHAQVLCAGGRLALTVTGPVRRLPQGEWVAQWAVELALTAANVLAQSRSVIIAVPDYRDLDQLHDTLTALEIGGVIRLDARRAAAERYRNFLHALDHEPRIIIGNRSAVYAPAHDLGAIIIWDDGDPLLGEPLAPYVHARDAALVRAQQTGAGLMLAAHMRSLEAHRLVAMGYLQPAAMAPRHGSVVHSGSMLSDEHSWQRIPEIVTAVIRKEATAGPVLVQVGMRGYALALACARCQDRVTCTHCHGPVASAADGTAACRWCGHVLRGWRCETCGSGEHRPRGAGSERTAEQLQHMFPNLKVIVSDATHLRSRVDARPSLVIATRGAEPIAAGGYRAVILLDIDHMLSLETLRATEDAMRNWHNALALSTAQATCVITGGAGSAVRSFVTGRWQDWCDAELRDRALLRFPPAVRIASVTGSAENVRQATQELTEMKGVEVLGPTPTNDGNVRAIVRFDYGQGATVASHLRAEVLRNASQHSAKTRALRGERSRRGAPHGALKLRFDDRGAFDDTGEGTP